MTKREARQQAAFTISLLIDDYLCAGQPWTACQEGALKNHNRSGDDCKDCDRIVDALRAYEESFTRRS